MIAHPDEAHYYQDAAPTERLYDAPIATRIMPVLAAVERSIGSAYATGALLVCGGAALGWIARAAFLPYDYYQLAWLVPLATLLIAWGNRQ